MRRFAHSYGLRTIWFSKCFGSFKKVLTADISVILPFWGYDQLRTRFSTLSF